MALFRRHKTREPAPEPAAGATAPATALPPGWDNAPPDRWPLIPREGNATDPLALGWGVGSVPATWDPAGEDPDVLVIAGPRGSGKTTLSRLLCDQAVCHNLAVLVLHVDHRHYPGHRNLLGDDPDLARVLQKTVQPGRCVVVDLQRSSSPTDGWPASGQTPPSPSTDSVAQAVSALSAQLIGDAVPAIVVVDGDHALDQVAGVLHKLRELGVWVVVSVQQPDHHASTLTGLRPQIAMLAPTTARAEDAGELCPAWAIQQIGAISGVRGRGVQVTAHGKRVARFVVPDDGEWVNTGVFVGQRINRSVAIDARNPGTAEDASL